MKLKYIGESFGACSLTDGNIYNAIEDNGMYRIIDDSLEDYLYSMTNPAPMDESSKGGKWEIVDNTEITYSEFIKIMVQIQEKYDKKASR